MLCKIIHSGGSTRCTLRTICDNVDYIIPFPAVRTISAFRQHKFLNNAPYNEHTLCNDVRTRYPEDSVLDTWESQERYTVTCTVP